MLTPEQKSKLELLTHHEKYGKILIEAIKSWELSKPMRRLFGIRFADTWKLEPFSNNCCCLIGAALLYKPANVNNYCQSITDNFSISVNETENLINGFDQNHSFCSSEAYNFGRQVSEIIFGEIK